MISGEGIRLRSTPTDYTDGLYSIIAGIAAAVLILIGSLLHLLWNGKALGETTARRIKLERAMEYGTHEVVNDWESWGLAFPVSHEKIEAELKRARKYENKLQRRRKLVIAAFLVGGAIFAILTLLFAVVSL